jgi:hypothetical protein
MRLQYCDVCAMVRVQKKYTPAHLRWFEEHTGGSPGEFGCRGVSGARENETRHQWVSLALAVVEG